MNSLVLTNLRIEHQVKPLGLDIKAPRFSWELQSDNKNILQISYELTVFCEKKVVWNSGSIESEDSIEVVYNGGDLQPMTSYDWVVKVWDNQGNYGSNESSFETGRMGVPWKAKWVEPVQISTEKVKIKKDDSELGILMVSDSDIQRDYSEFRPVQYLRLNFEAKPGLRQARVYATAHGVYRLEVNGIRADDREFAPEITAYEKLLQYQVYDVKDKIIEGENTFGITLGDGWWCGRVGLTGDACQYGDAIGVLIEGVLTYEDGTVEVICGDQALSSTGPIIFSDIFVGEKYDANKEMEGWSTARFDDSKWIPVQIKCYPMNNIKAQYGEPVRPIRIFKPVEIIQTPAGETVLDLGQNIAGNVEFTVTSPAGITIKLEHSEVLDEKGNFLNNILGINKEQTDYYITKKGTQTYRPAFSYHGFRYVRITGWPGEAAVKDFTAYVLSSEMEDIGTFETSDPKINRLQQNIWWSQVGNTLSIPTDCPQRERAGWTGDIMAFSPTMCYNRNADSFLSRWLESCRADQTIDGQIPMVVPYLEGYRDMSKVFKTDTSCGWGDAILLVPWAMYKAYGDKQILRTNYEAMKKWMSYVENEAKTGKIEGYESFDEERKARQQYLWNTGFHFGDWLIPSLVLGNPDGAAMMQTAFATMGIVAPSYYAFNTDVMAKIAETLGEKEDVTYYSDLNEKIRKAFIEEYVHEDGTLDANFQGIYVICLKNNLVTDEIRPKMVSHLRKMIQDNSGCLDTGFLSILFLMDVLCENDCRDIAYSLMYQNKCPSWLYEVEKGATTMWESWGAISPNGTVSSYSYNHYAFGCVGEWLYREIGGLQAAIPGYKKIRIKPSLDCGLTFAKASLHTPYGIATVSWEIQDGLATVDAVIPANTTAEVIIDGNLTEIGSGSYQFTSRR